MSTGASRRLRPVGSIALVLLALAGLIFVVSALPFEALGEMRLRQMSAWSIPAVAVLHVLYLVISAEVWRRMLRMVSGTTVSYFDAYLQMSAVAVGKYVPGKVWGFVARVAQLRRDDVPARLSVAGSALEQVLVIAGACVVVIAAGVLAFPEYRLYALISGAILVAVLLYASHNLPVIVRWLGRQENDRSAPDEKYSAVRLLMFSLVYAVLWLLSGAILSIIYFSTFDASVSTVAVAAIIIANTVGFIAGFLAVFSPGGLGVREAATVLVLSPFLPVREVIVATISLRALIVVFDGLNALVLMLGEARYAVDQGNGTVK